MTPRITARGASIAFIIIVAIGFAASLAAQLPPPPPAPIQNPIVYPYTLFKNEIEGVSSVVQTQVSASNAINNPIWGLVTDQRWIELIPNGSTAMFQYQPPLGTANPDGTGSYYPATVTLRDGDNDPADTFELTFNIYVWKKVELVAPEGHLATVAPGENFSIPMHGRYGISHGGTGGNIPNRIFFVYSSYAGPTWGSDANVVAPTWIVYDQNSTMLNSLPPVPGQNPQLSRLLSGVPPLSAIGVHEIQILLVDMRSHSVHNNGGALWSVSYDLRTYTIEVAVPPIDTLTPQGSLGTIMFGQTFTADINADGGYGVLTYSSDDLPQWLSLDAQTGALTGTPETADDVRTHVFHVTVTDEFPDTTNVATFEYSVEVVTAPLTIVSPFNLPMARMGDVYTAQLHAIGGAGGFHWSVDDLPIGITLGDSGALSGIPEVEGVYPLDVAVQDDVTPPNIERTVLSLVVQGAEEALLNITTSHLPPATEGHVYTPLSLAAAGGTGSYAWEVVGLPTGMEVNGNVIVGTPLNDSEGVYHVQVVVSDGVSSTSTIYPFVVMVAAEVIELEETTPTLIGSLDGALMSGAAAAGCSIDGSNGGSDSGIWWGWFVLGLGMIAWRSSSRTTARS